ncbi:hypothetical protein AGMMS49941_13480 [Deferribacterales bacterium]|nr:hypothetical protein AGMMS49941_13480 [Deferribacterales bacterium]
MTTKELKSVFVMEKGLRKELNKIFGGNLVQSYRDSITETIENVIKGLPIYRANLEIKFKDQKRPQAAADTDRGVITFYMTQDSYNFMHKGVSEEDYREGVWDIVGTFFHEYNHFKCNGEVGEIAYNRYGEDYIFFHTDKNDDEGKSKKNKYLNYLSIVEEVECFAYQYAIKQMLSGDEPSEYHYEEDAYVEDAYDDDVVVKDKEAYNDEMDYDEVYRSKDMNRLVRKTYELFKTVAVTQLEEAKEAYEEENKKERKNTVKK